jgi:ABC-type transport system involved in cytochrome c biogenesis permease subunit
MEILDHTNLLTQVAGLIFLSLGIASGSGLALMVWERLPLTDPKILLSAALWLFFLVSIFLRSVLRWSGRRMSFLPVIGFALIAVILVFESLGRGTLHRF